MDNVDKYKYPRTPHLPWSNGTKDDIYLSDISNFQYFKKVVVTEKLDGENITMYNNYIHSRSLDFKNHISRDWIKALHGNIKYSIDKNLRICGENLYGKHSILYSELETYFYVFALYHKNFNEHVCLDYNTTVKYIENILHLKFVPVLYIGIWDEFKIKQCFTGISKLGGYQEGYVVRNYDRFDFKDFDKNVAKFVRPCHIQTDKNWFNNWNKYNKNELTNHLKKLN